MDSDIDFFKPVLMMRETITSHWKWTVSISIFLITVSLAILALGEKTTPFCYLMLAITLVILLFNVVFSWHLLNKSLSLAFAIFYSVVPFPLDMNIEEKKKELNKRAEDSNNLIKKFGRFIKIESKIQTLSFLFGFGFFLTS